MRRLATAALVYFAIVFAAGFIFGAIRVGFVVPRIGEFAAVLLELPFLLAISWFVAGWILKRFPMTERREAIATGVGAFVVLILAEAALSTLIGDSGIAGFLARLASAAGLVGLAGQFVFAALLALRFGRQ